MRKPPFTWKCPYCEMQQIITEYHHYASIDELDLEPTNDGGDNRLCGIYEKIKCANPKCNHISIYSTIYLEEFRMVQISSTSKTRRLVETKKVLEKRLIPYSEARIIPSFIPKPIADDYLEACLIKDLSPKASATLIRRCLQGMIRDFCGISKNRLLDEICELRKQVEENTAPREISIESVEAIDATRKIGNIGAHMEKDVNIIIDVEPNEAQSLIELVEILIEDWYIARENRKHRFSKPIEIKENKETMKQTKN